MELPQWVQVTLHHMLGLFSLKLMKMALNNMLGYLKGCSHVHLSKLTQKRIPLNFQVKKWKHNLRSEEHTSELQSRGHLVCRLLLEKRTTINKDYNNRGL